MKPEHKINSGGPAFPRTCDAFSQGSDGMTLRDYFAGQALAGECYSFEKAVTGLSQRQEIAEACYIMADAMIAARG